MGKRTLIILWAIALAAAAIVGRPAAAGAGRVALAWDRVEGVDGYRIYMRIEGQAYDYSKPAWQDTALQCTIADLAPGVSYYFVARAYRGSNESGNSNEVGYLARDNIPTKPVVSIIKEDDMVFVNTEPVPENEVDHFEVELDGVVSTVDPQRDAQAGTAQLHLDVTGVSLGSHTVRIRGVNMWGGGEYCDPFVFEKALPSKPSGVGLSVD